MSYTFIGNSALCLMHALAIVVLCMHVHVCAGHLFYSKLNLRVSATLIRPGAPVARFLEVHWSSKRKDNNAVALVRSKRSRSWETFP